MVTIEIEEFVYEFIKNNAIPYVDKTPGETLKRLFGLDKNNSGGKIDRLTYQELLKTIPSVEDVAPSRKPRTHYPSLVRDGLLKEGQKLFLLDHRGEKVEGEEAVFENGMVRDEKGDRASLSYLAGRLLRKHGFNSNSVRGTSHWAIEDGRSVQELWDDFLEKNPDFSY